MVLERRSQDYVLSRIRAGVLEAGTVRVLEEAGVGARAAAEGLPHEGVEFSWHDERIRIDLEALTGQQVTVYGQTEVTRDLYDAAAARDARIVHEAEVLRIEDIETDAPVVVYRKDGAEHRLEARFVAGCDGYHGPSRKAMPKAVHREFERAYPFGWLGLLSRTPLYHAGTGSMPRMSGALRSVPCARTRSAAITSRCRRPRRPKTGPPTNSGTS